MIKSGCEHIKNTAHRPQTPFHGYQNTLFFQSPIVGFKRAELIDKGNLEELPA